MPEWKCVRLNSPIVPANVFVVPGFTGKRYLEFAPSLSMTDAGAIAVCAATTRRQKASKNEMIRLFDFKIEHLFIFNKSINASTATPVAMYEIPGRIIEHFWSYANDVYFKMKNKKEYTEDANSIIGSAQK